MRPDTNDFKAQCDNKADDDDYHIHHFKSMVEELAPKKKLKRKRNIGTLVKHGLRIVAHFLGNINK